MTVLQQHSDLQSVIDVIASDNTYSIANSLIEKMIGYIILFDELIKSLKFPQLKDRDGFALNILEYNHSLPPKLKNRHHTSSLKTVQITPATVYSSS